MDAADITMLQILGVAVTPSIVGLLLALLSLWLPPDDCKQLDDAKQ